MKKLRYYLIKTLLNDDERFVLSEAIRVQRDNLSEQKVSDENADPFDIESDRDMLARIVDVISIQEEL